ncbi:MAG TPA: CHAT domain-containing tetratricopeptide repeat protein [Candidatus Angelobacter sp.]|nr:CHAT domain-containing tetratricopeptide repeat protein [Candidatus Angelobacter sp.]
MNAPPYRNCPGDEVLQELAAGISSPELAAQIMPHVARCETCGPAFRRYLQEFSDETSPENARIRAQLQSSKPKWQKKLVRDAIGRPRKAPWMKLVPALVMLGLVVAAIFAAPGLMGEYKIHQAQKQTAEAFAARRTTKMRLTSAAFSDYKPFPTVLGNDGGRELDEIPAELASASSTASEKLQAKNADPRWLQVQGRALLWEATPASLEKAEKDFETAKASGLNSPSLDIDLAATFFERDSKAEHPNLQRSLNLLSEVLSRPALNNEDRASALYDLAIAYEKTQAWDLAVATWEKFLQAEPSGAWASDARQHMDAAKAKMGDKRQQSYSDPSFFLQQIAQHSLRPEDPEQYQQKALSQWLPSAMADKSSNAFRAVDGLAEVFINHQDSWWKDFLGEITPEELPAVNALSSAVRANDAGKYDDAATQSAQAFSLFNRSHNKPGELRASFEEVYASRRTLNGGDCLARADPLAKSLSLTQYRWLTARVLLEQADCRNLYGQFADSDSSLVASRQMARDFGFPVLVLQNLGISAGINRLRGNCDESWKASVSALEQYWQVVHARGERLFQFYAVMLQCSLDTGALNEAEALIQHTIAMRQDPTADIASDASIEGLLHLHLANILLAQRQTAQAGAERSRALELLRQPKGPWAEKYRLITEVEPAEFQLQRGDSRAALETLNPVMKLLSGSQDKFFPLRCTKLLGDIYLRLGEYDRALMEYQAAIGIAEASLANLKVSSTRLAWLRATDDSYRGVVRVLLAEKKDREALDSWEHYRSMPLLPDAQVQSGLRSAKPVVAGGGGRSHDIARAPGTRLVYAGFPDGVQIWIASNGSVHGKWIATEQQDFEQLAHDFVRKCATESSNLKELQQQGQKLYSLLIDPVLSDISAAPVLTVELDKRIYNLPMEALQSSDGVYLAERHAVVYSPGSDIDESLNPSRRITGNESLLLLDATRSPQAGYLPGMEEERKTIAQIFSHTSVVDSASSSWPSVRRMLAESDIFHYMGHGLPAGTATGLLFTETRPLRAQDFVPEIFKHSQLVVLAACSSGKGREGVLDTDSLIHALFAAGVPRVIASQWNVDSASTSQLMQSFYRSLGKNRTVPEAMFDARNEMIRKTPHPYYWAGFSVEGTAN